jgi:hypothetical protein
MQHSSKSIGSLLLQLNDLLVCSDIQQDVNASYDNVSDLLQDLLQVR